MKKRILLKTLYILIVCMLVSSLVFSSSSITVNENYFNGMFEFIDMFYRTDIGVDSIMASSLNGVLEGMSEYSCFELAVSQSGNSFSGIGANLEKTRDGFIIVSVGPSSPAFKAGLQAGDIIYRIDKQNAAVMSIEAFKAYLTVQESVLIEAKIRKTGQLMTVRVDTQPDYKNDVDYVILDEAGYIRLNAFSNTTADLVEGVLGSISSLGIDIIILDLRNLVSMNITDASAVAGLLSEGGTISRTKAGTYNVRKKKAEYNVKVLVNELTAGAGEVIAAAVPSVIYGQTTAGEASHIMQYPVFTDAAYKKYSERFRTDSIFSLVRILKSSGIELDESEIIGYLNLVESGVYNSSGKLISEETRIVPDVAVTDTSIGFMDFTPGEGMINIARDYKSGSINYDVFLAKKILSALGYFNGPMTVVFGDDMTRAVNDYKSGVGFSADGVLDMSTQAMLNTYSMKTAVMSDKCVQAALEDIV